jgi:hypothetical protein
MRVQLKYLLVFSIGCSAFLACKSAGSDAKLDGPLPIEKVSDLKAQLKKTDATVEMLLGHGIALIPELQKTRTVDDFLFEVEYMPHTLLCLMNKEKINNAEKLTQDLLKDADTYENLHYFKMSISNKNNTSELLRYNLQSVEDYAHRVSYYAFHIKEDVKLICNDNDTITKAFVNFERTFDMSPKLNLTFVFDAKGHPPITKLRLVYNDAVFNNGQLSFEIDYVKIKHLNTPYYKTEWL